MSITERHLHDRLGIVELGEVCARLRARNLDLFEQLGGWVTTTSDPEAQRMFATACHRHAWHADLWAERAPTIPPVDLEALTASHRTVPVAVEPADREAAYRAAVEELRDELDRLAGGIDPVLDPSTVRTLTLVRNDLT